MAVSRLEIKSIRPFADGQSFGQTGPYRQLEGLVHFAIDPESPANETITDLKLAPRDAAGLVHCVADFCILQPEAPKLGNHRILFDVVNRGNPTVLTNLNSADQRLGAGNGFLMRQGYTIVWCGWQYDVPSDTPDLVGATVPEALTPAGEPISGPTSFAFQPHRVIYDHPLADRQHQPHPVSDPKAPDAELTVRQHQDAPPRPIPREQWAFARWDSSTVIPDASHIYLKSGFQPGQVYEASYITTGAAVVGMGLLTPRDLVSFLRYASAAEGNPCAQDIQYAYAFGRSQSGGFLRRFLYCALTQDEQDRPVFEGVIPLVAGGGRGEMNQRFGQPSTPPRATAGRIFPFHDTRQTDPDTGRSDGLLARLNARGKTPKVFFINTSAEYWSGHASLIHATLDAAADLPPSDLARIYHYAGTQHGPGRLTLYDVDVRQGPRSQQPDNSVDYRPLLRAALANLDAWVSHGRTPPPSSYPRLADGTAVPPEQTQALFQSLPGVNFPEQLKYTYRLDFGPEVYQGLISKLPPTVGEPYPNLVSAVDADGNEIAGIRLPDVSVPVATNTGWNLRHPDSGGPGQIMPQIGSSIPFPATRADREAGKDPRAAIAERYSSRKDYLNQVRQAAQALIDQRHLLAEDLEVVLEQAAERYDALGAQKAKTLAATGD